MPIAFPSLATMNFLCHLGKWITAERLNILLAVLTLLLAVLTFLLAWRVAHPQIKKSLGGLPFAVLLQKGGSLFATSPGFHSRILLFDLSDLH